MGNLYHIHLCHMRISAIVKRMACSPTSLPPHLLTLTLDDPILLTAIQQPTPPLPPLYLTHFDQNYNYYYNIAQFFHSNRQRSHENVLVLVREALRHLLVHYPWVQGRFRFNEESQRLEVDCSSKGVIFVAGTAHVTLAELGDAISAPGPLLDSLIPRLPTEGKADLASLPILLIQVTRFSCGGFALATVGSRILFDGYSMGLFLQNLGSIARGEGLVVAPSVARERLMPRNPPSPMFDHDMELSPKGKKDVHGPPRTDALVGKTYIKFTFSEEMLEQLRSEALSDETLQKCTLFEAIAAHMWRAKAKISKDSAPSEPFPLRTPVNLRHRIKPAFPGGYLGNGAYPATAIATIKELTGNPLSFAVRRVQEAIGKITGEYIQSAVDWMELHNGKMKRMDSGIRISSFARLPFSEVDVGWGKPMCQCMSGVDHGVETLRCVPERRGTRAMGVYAFMDEEERSGFGAAVGGLLGAQG